MACFFSCTWHISLLIVSLGPVVFCSVASSIRFVQLKLQDNVVWQPKAQPFTTCPVDTKTFDRPYLIILCCWLFRLVSGLSGLVQRSHVSQGNIFVSDHTTPSANTKQSGRIRNIPDRSAFFTPILSSIARWDPRIFFGGRAVLTLFSLIIEPSKGTLKHSANSS